MVVRGYEAVAMVIVTGRYDAQSQLAQVGPSAVFAFIYLIH